MFEVICKKDLKGVPQNVRKSGIICTLGPKSQSLDVISELCKAGMNIARLNFSHGSHEQHEKLLATVRQCQQHHVDFPFAVALDTKGPEIRTGVLKNGLDFIQIRAGQSVTLTTDISYEQECDENFIFVDYPDLIKSVRETGIVFIDDGVLCLDLEEILPNGKSIKCRARNDYQLTSKKGVNLPGAKVHLPSLSEKDKKDLKFAVQHEMDMIFASFIRKASDIEEIRNVLGDAGRMIKIISKIESQEGLDNFDEILNVSDGIMVARGDLGIEIPPEKVFVAQKMIITKCNIAGKPVICATQMLESMIRNPTPTRAEVSDVANAVLDGADCVMLSGETASGNYPIQSVQIMHRVIIEAESVFPYLCTFEEIRKYDTKDKDCITRTIASSAANAALDTQIQAIIVLTISGRTSAEVARYRPAVPIITVTRNACVARQIHLYRGCYPMLYSRGIDESKSWQQDIDARVDWAVAEGKKRGWLTPGHSVVIIQGWKGGSGNTNSLRIVPIL